MDPGHCTQDDPCSARDIQGQAEGCVSQAMIWNAHAKSYIWCCSFVYQVWWRRAAIAYGGRLHYNSRCTEGATSCNCQHHLVRFGCWLSPREVCDRALTQYRRPYIPILIASSLLPYTAVQASLLPVGWWSVKANVRLCSWNCWICARVGSFLQEASDRAPQSWGLLWSNTWLSEREDSPWLR